MTTPAVQALSQNDFTQFESFRNGNLTLENAQHEEIQWVKDTCNVIQEEFLQFNNLQRQEIEYRHLFKRNRYNIHFTQAAQNEEPLDQVVLMTRLVE